MSIENIIIYFLLPVLGWLLLRTNKIERKLLMIIVMLNDRGFKVPAAGDTDRLFKNSKGKI